MNFQVVSDTVQSVTTVPCPCPKALGISTLTYLVCFAGGFLGALFHFIQNLKTSEAKAKLGHYEWSQSTYIHDERKAIIGSFVWVIICMFVLPEIAAKYESILDWKKVVFLVMGYGGDSLASKWFGEAEKRANGVFDTKTTTADIADKTLEGPPTPAVMPSIDPLKKVS